MSPLKREEWWQVFMLQLEVEDTTLRVVCKPRDGHKFGERGFDEGFVDLVDPITGTSFGSCGTNYFEREAIPITIEAL